MNGLLEDMNITDQQIRDCLEGLESFHNQWEKGLHESAWVCYHAQVIIRELCRKLRLPNEIVKIAL